ncbi:Nucleoside-diphosphate-sugar epimerase [Penicillium angulare]|uniref:UDP-glucuronic acid decarboxylase 1 n=1 Tax=Penicillium angulare TaxID=116970 RepID=A0A9W9F6R0_9EURO|nr:Nucleoside-diphosphate-sugar epimerase [Penicillium angulare]
MLPVLVTGGAGFLGSHLIRILLERNYRVIAIDSLWTGSLDSIANIQDHPNFTFLRHDVTLPFTGIINDVSQIYHLACPASPKHFVKNPIDILNKCFQGTKNVLDFAVKCNARVLLASTSEVYGDPLVYPQAESYYGNVNPFGPRSCYDEGKRVAEAMAYAFRLENNLDIRIGRIFNAYVPGMLPSDGRVVPNFISAAIGQKDMQIAGDGNARRCFQYVGDCVLGLYTLMQSSCLSPVNIGCDDEISIANLAQLINDIVSRKTASAPVDVLFTEKSDDDPFRRRPEISMAKEKLQWQPRVGLRDGLEMTVNWFLAFLAAI